MSAQSSPKPTPIPPGFIEVKFGLRPREVSLLLPAKTWQAMQDDNDKKRIAEAVEAIKRQEKEDQELKESLETDEAAILEAKLEAKEFASKQAERIARLQKQAKDAENLAKGIDPEAAALLEADQLPAHPKLHLQVYESLAPLVLGKKAKATDRDVSNRNKDLLTTLTALGSYRRIVAGPEDLSFLDELLESHPHFAAVTEFVRGQITMARQLGKPLHLPPIMLGGGPGLGKTHYAQALAKAIGIPCRRQGMDSAVTGAAFTGSDKKWANTTTGFLFDLICTGKPGEVPVANPMVLLDELDKTTQSNDSPLAPLHTLLEPVSSARVRDLSADMEFNCSQVVWIATANLLFKIPDSLRSRFREFWIELPTGKEAIQLAGVVVRETVNKLGQGTFSAPCRAIAVKLAHLSAREIYQATEEAMARAFMNGRSNLLIGDLPIEVLRDDDKHGKGADGPTGYLH